MNCRDFDRIWNQSLDDHRRAAVDACSWTAHAEALREHAESCPPCRSRHRRFETLLRALDAWAARPETRPTPSPELVDRIIAAVARPESPEVDRRRRIRPAVAAVALASAAAVLFAVLGPRFRPEPPPSASVSTSSPASADLRDKMDLGILESTVGDATAASWQLALLASEPATRLGKEMIDASFEPDSAADDGSFRAGGLPAASDLPTIDPESFSPELIYQMGGLLADGVRPLSNSARHAFGFLRVPTIEKPERPVVRPAAKGA